MWVPKHPDLGPILHDLVRRGHGTRDPGGPRCRPGGGSGSGRYRWRPWVPRRRYELAERRFRGALGRRRANRAPGRRCRGGRAAKTLPELDPGCACSFPTTGRRRRTSTGSNERWTTSRSSASAANTYGHPTPLRSWRCSASPVPRSTSPRDGRRREHRRSAERAHSCGQIRHDFVLVLSARTSLGGLGTLRGCRSL